MVGSCLRNVLRGPLEKYSGPEDFIIGDESDIGKFVRIQLNQKTRADQENNRNYLGTGTYPIRSSRTLLEPPKRLLSHDSEV